MYEMCRARLSILSCKISLSGFGPPPLSPCLHRRPVILRISALGGDTVVPSDPCGSMGGDGKLGFEKLGAPVFLTTAPTPPPPPPRSPHSLVLVVILVPSRHRILVARVVSDVRESFVSRSSTSSVTPTAPVWWIQWACFRP